MKVLLFSAFVTVGCLCHDHRGKSTVTMVIWNLDWITFSAEAYVL
uniref:Uncharacterized protein n=1 Tax=Setaria viridis TaxID=4556 RepID=A0A4U6W5H0_SETVI|nr:hypothetical protein SEVIR_1G072250v2 [Setaria viridis]